MIELLFALETMGRLLDDRDILSTDIRASGSRQLNPRGIGVIEAPRGTLIHDYTVDENGLLARVNLIVATGHNNWAMNQAVATVAGWRPRFGATTPVYPVQPMPSAGCRWRWL